ncbi:DNA repair protein RecO [Rothia dentocariosa]|uniref:DNA repair protein RecO n=1 Tax=Rothia dentocariosa TaxID=2047 RepID=UPI0028809C02|nr:DNA repair protein RecO [Rothia dentocariosa]
MSTPKHLRDHALILRTQNLGEADRIIIMLTQNNGVIHAVAKSIRKPNSKFGARLEPYMHTDISLTRGKTNLHTISQTATIHAYTATLMGNYNAYTAANTIAEIAETLNTNSTPHDTNPHYHLTHGAIATLAHNKHTPQRILTSYILRAMKLAGWLIFTDTCTYCNQPITTGYHPAGTHGTTGTLCKTCAHQNDTPTTPITPTEYNYIQALYKGNWDTIDNASPLAARKILNLTLHTTQNYLETPLKTLTYLELET